MTNDLRKQLHIMLLSNGWYSVLIALSDLSGAMAEITSQIRYKQGGLAARWRVLAQDLCSVAERHTDII